MLDLEEENMGIDQQKPNDLKENEMNNSLNHIRDRGWTRMGDPPQVDITGFKASEEPMLFTKNGFEALTGLEEETVGIDQQQPDDLDINMRNNSPARHANGSVVHGTREVLPTSSDPSNASFEFQSRGVDGALEKPGSDHYKKNHVQWSKKY